MTTAVLVAALAYASLGLRVHPLRACDKRPLLQGWPDRATTDPTVIEEWWRQWPSAGVGIATGTASGVLVLDVDPRHGGDDELARLEREHGEFPPTWRCLTAGGGLHLYFSHPGGEVRNRGRLRPGIDLRGDGGYAVGPPTTLDGGRRYIWETGYGPEDLAPADAPAWLLGMIHGDRCHRLRRDGTPLVVAAGARNNTLMQLAGLLRRQGLNEAAIMGCLEAINRHHLCPPLDAKEIASVARSAARYSPQAGAKSS